MRHSLVFLPLFAFAPMVTAAEPVYDIVVYGGTSGGVIAAVQAARHGQDRSSSSSRARHLGGLTSGGLGATDIGNKQAIGGMSREFYRRIHRHYPNPTPGNRRPARNTSPAESGARSGRGHDVDLRAPRRRSRSTGGCSRRPVFRSCSNERLDLGPGVEKTASGSRSILMESGRLRRAGLHRRHLRRRPDGRGGRVATRSAARPTRRTAKRSTASQTAHAQAPPVHRSRSIPTWNPATRRAACCPASQPDARGADGAGDQRVQAYCFRMCLTDVAENRIPFAEARGLRRARLRTALAQFRGRRPTAFPWNHGPHAQPQDGHEQQLRRLDRQHRHELRLPRRRLRRRGTGSSPSTELVPAGPDVDSGQPSAGAGGGAPRISGRWGLAKDEFTDNGNSDKTRFMGGGLCPGLKCPEDPCSF